MRATVGESAVELSRSAARRCGVATLQRVSSAAYFNEDLSPIAARKAIPPYKLCTNTPEFLHMDDSTYRLTDDERVKIARRYEIVESVAHGGMGIVFRGHDKTLKRSVALKVCRPGVDVERLRREAITLAKIRSPHVVAVHDFEAISDDRGLLVMDWIEGKDLAAIVRDPAFTLNHDTVLEWMSDVCRGMMTAESQRVVHRDLKPSNIIIDRQNKAMVTDFGLATSPTLDQLSSTGQMLGTPFYMAPEQAEDPHNVDTRADVYSFGATFYHICTRQPPFSGKTPWTVVLKHKTEPLVPPRSYNPSIPTVVNDCIERCLAKNPTDRFSAFSDILAVLRSSSSVDAWSYTQDDALMNYIGVYNIHRDQLLSPKGMPSDQPVIFDFPSSRRMSIFYDDLSRQDVDAVVSSDDAMLSMGGGVSASLRRKAGETLRVEAQRFVPVRAGRVVVTSAGALPSRFVFHGVTIGVEGDRWRFPTRDVIAEIVDSCFYEAETLSIESIAFPLLGTGAGGFPRDIALDTIFRAVAHRLLRRASSIKDVRIVLRA